MVIKHYLEFYFLIKKIFKEYHYDFTFQVQFCANLCKVTYTIYNGCQYPRLFQKLLFVYMISLIALFSNFFYQTYHVRIRAKVHGSTSKKPRAENVNHNEKPALALKMGGASYRLRSGVRKDN